MKRKLTFNTLALNNLKNRKKQYTLLIIGIVLSMVFSSSVIYLGYSAYYSLEEKQKADYGIFDQLMFNADKEVIEGACEQGYIESAGWGYTIGYAFTDTKDKLNGTSVAKLDETAKMLANPVLLEGEYPSEAGEIAIEKVALAKLGIPSAEVGDTVTVKFSVQNGTEYSQQFQEKSYILTGILRDKKSNLSASIGISESEHIPAAFVSEKEKIELGGKENLVCYYTVRKDYRQQLFAYFSNVSDIDNLVYNSGDEMFLDGDGYGITESIGYVIVFVVALLIVSAVGIVNAFTSNLKERKKQIGMYRAVGATKRQIRIMFGREAIFLSLVCTPVSVLISYLLVRVFITFINDELIFAPDIRVLILCGAFSFVCVMVASFIPLVSASRITPMQAIRKIDTTRKIKRKNLKSKTEFRVSKLIAQRNLIISKGKQVTVSLFLVISIILSCYAFSYYTYTKDNYYHETADYKMDVTRDISSFAINYPETNNGFTESHKQTVFMNEYIGEAYGFKKINANILVDEMTDYLKLSEIYMYDWDYNRLAEVDKDNYEKIFFSKLNLLQTKLKNALGYEDYFCSYMYGIDGSFMDRFQKNIIDGEINIAKINSGEEVIVFAPEKIAVGIEEFMPGEYDIVRDTYISPNGEYFAVEECSLKAGDTIEVSILSDEKFDSNYEDNGGDFYTETMTELRKTVKIGAIIEGRISDYGIFVGDSDIIKVVTTIDGLEHFAKDIRYKQLYFNLNRECTDEIDKSVMSTIDSIGEIVDDSYVSSDYAYLQSQKQSLRMLLVITLALVFLVFTVCASIINNTLTANIREDKKKIGTLRAVGAGEKELSLCYIKQLLSMFKWGYGFGFGGFVLSYIVLLLVGKSLETQLPFVFSPWLAVLIGLLVFIFCAANLWLKVRKEMKNSIVENIREL